MIITRTPYRISFFGGGTDYPCWYREHGGAVLAGAIDKFCYLSVRYLPPFFDHRYRIVYSSVEISSRVDQIQHPVIRNTIQFLKISEGLEIHYDGDLPAHSGMGSSSSCTVGLLHALSALIGASRDKAALARDSIHIERDLIPETVGSQDQVCAAYGGLNEIRFAPSGEIEVLPLRVKAERLGEITNSLMLFYTGFRRNSSAIAKTYVDELPRKQGELATLRRFVSEGRSLIESDAPIAHLGELLDEGWKIKRSISSNISTQRIDEIYQAGLAAGALGGKLLGAGAGGFFLFVVPRERQRSVAEKLAPLLHVPFRFDFEGSRRIFDSAANSSETGQAHRIEGV